MRFQAIIQISLFLVIYTRQDDNVHGVKTVQQTISEVKCNFNAQSLSSCDQTRRKSADHDDDNDVEENRVEIQKKIR